MPGLDRLDLLDAGALTALIRKSEPEAVFLPAANPFVDYCESHPEETRRLNVDATLAAARVVRDAGARLVFFSTDYVFDGRKQGAYVEDDPVSPLNEYGRQKAAVERALGGALVLRVSSVYGQDSKNFAAQVVRSLREGKPLRAASDQVSNPTYAPDMAEAALDLAAKGASGVYHLAGSEALSRAEFARAAAAAFGLRADLVEAVPASSFADPAGARRPSRSSLSSAKAEALTGRRLLGARRGLERMREAEKEIVS